MSANLRRALHGADDSCLPPTPATVQREMDQLGQDGRFDHDGYAYAAIGYVGL
jgi:hypothetical protein